MPDPAILSLLHHLTSPPPAIVWQAPTSFVGPLAAAFETLVADQERKNQQWIDEAVIMQKELHKVMKLNTEELNYDSFSHIIAQLEKNLRKQSRVKVRRAMGKKPDGLDPRTQALRERVLKSQQALYEAGLDFVLYLRAMRAEVSPESRGGPSFDNPDDLEKYILAQVA